MSNSKQLFVDKVKKLPYREQIFYFAIFTWSSVAIISTPISIYIEDYASLFANVTSIIINILLYIGYKKTKRLDTISLFLLWSIAIVVFILNTLNKYDLDVVLILFIPLLGSLMLQRHVLIRQGFLFTLILASFILYGYMQHPDYVLFSHATYFISFINLYIFTVAFAFTYHVFIESAYAELDKSNRAKEVLLQEIHHRVKNNLNMMSSILALQCKTQNNETVKILQTNRSRIDSIAMVHESLYENENFHDIDFKFYVNKLIRHLMFISSKQNVNINIQSDGIYFSLDTMTTLALLLQELIANSIKYSLNTVNPSVSIILKESDNYDYYLSYCDDGDKIVDNYKPSLGMKIVGLKVKEMNGTLDINTEKGFKYTIEFNLLENVV